MPRTRVKEKFQVTIPAPIRKKLGIKVGDEFEAVIKDENILLQPQAVMDRSKAKAIEEFSAIIRESGERNKDFSDEEVMQDVLEEIRAYRQEKHAQSGR